MGKFKVGDEIIFTASVHKFETQIPLNTPYKIKRLDGYGFIVEHQGEEMYIASYEFDIVKKVNTKKKRIKALEERVEMVDGIIRDVRSDNYHEIEAMKKEIAELRKVMENYFKVPVEPSTDDIEDKPKTPNQLRAEIIEKAKGYLEKNKARDGYYPVKSGSRIPYSCNAEFIVNEEKRTVVVLLRGFQSNDIYAKGIAKCNPSDVFNEHIGKAIALGRALGLDVSEFEGAVQPTEVVVGHKISRVDSLGYTYVKTVKKFDYNAVFYENDGGWDYKESLRKDTTIINDTHAIYKEDK